MADASNLPTLRAFLESAPLYKRTEVQYAGGLIRQLMKRKQGQTPSDFPDSVNLPCYGCGRETSWTRQQEHALCDADVVAYACAGCGKATTGFWVRLEKGREVKTPPQTLSNNMAPSIGVVSAFATKIGQTELPVPPATKALDKLLGPDRALYRKGLACMAEGFGLGAVAYFRRVIEDRTGDILLRMRRVAELEADGGAVAKIDEAARSERVSDRLKLAVDAVPKALRPGGINPLGILYGAFSEELHASESDDAALTTAQELHAALDVLVKKLVEHDADVRTLANLQKR